MVGAVGEKACDVAGMQGSVDLVAERAGVTASYLLRLFGTKKALFLAVVERAFDDTLSEYEQATKDTTGARRSRQSRRRAGG